MDGDSLGHFTLLEKIGEGGMGRVYKAWDTRLERFVAIKLLPEAKLGDAERRARFVVEARTASALNHPNIITIYEIGEQNGQAFIVMELVDGKPLSEIVPHKGMRLTEALRIAVQTADALTAAHAAGIVHRDLKPGNLMVDGRGRVKVLDFGLAKLNLASGAEDATRSMSVERARTEEGMVMGSVPYMSPEQAEGRPVDARSDIFSFGTVLYEMITGQRPFRGESRATTLASIVEKDPQAISEISGGVPHELERLITRCLRKDVNRRSQNMADVKVALEELRDESESGKLSRSNPGGARQNTLSKWIWPAVAVTSMLVAASAITWVVLSRRVYRLPQSAELARVSPDDGHSYSIPALSPDGKFVSYISDRGGAAQLWLQQVAGGEPIQLTHSPESVLSAQFFPDGARLIYSTHSVETNSGHIEAISTLGGEPRLIADVKATAGGVLSPDGRQFAYVELESPGGPARLKVVASDGGLPRELPSWAKTQALLNYRSTVAWTSDSRYLLAVGSRKFEALTFEDWDWLALPVNGGEPRPTGAGDAFRAMGLKLSDPVLMKDDRVLFAGARGEQENIWEIRLTRDSWRVRGAPRQLTFATEHQRPSSINGSGTLALESASLAVDFYLLPLSPVNAQPAGATRRLTRDGRYKYTWTVGGDPSLLYFRLADQKGDARDGYSLDMESGKQQLLMPGPLSGVLASISPDGRRIAYSVPEGNSISIYLGDPGAPVAAARILCKACGLAWRFSADGRFLFYQPEYTPKLDYKRKHTVRLLEVATGKDRPWLEHPTDSIMLIGTFGQDREWVTFRVQANGEDEGKWYIAPWREQPVPFSEWIELTIPRGANYSPSGNFFAFFQGARLMVRRFDPKAHAMSDPYELKFPAEVGLAPTPNDPWLLRGPGLVFTRRESTSSIWLTKLPD